MRRYAWLSPFLIGLCMACSHNTGPAASPQPKPLPSKQSAPIADSKSAPPVAPIIDPLRLTAQRSHDGRSAVGTVLLRQPPAPDAGPSPHLKLAGTRAWLALGEQRLNAEDWAGAVACAQAGLDELGSQYAGRGALDHTSMKLSIAKDDIRMGRLDNAADIMLNQLAIRTRYYVQLHTADIAE